MTHPVIDPMAAAALSVTAELTTTARSALPGSPVVPHSPRAARLVTLRRGLAAVLQAAARKVEPGSGTQTTYTAA